MASDKTMAYVNLYAVLSSLETLVTLDEKAKEIATTDKPLSIGFNVNDGPKARIEFNSGVVKMVPDELGGKIGLKFFNPEHFNQMITGEKMPVPYKGLASIGFVMKNFVQLTDILTDYLRASEESLKDRDFYIKSTTLMFYLVVSALSQIANKDKLGKLAAARVPDGEIAIEIVGGPCACIVVNDGEFTTIKSKSENPRAFMIFDGFDTARGLFDGSVNAMNCVSDGRIVMKGYIPMIQNLNNILGLVSGYLA